MSYALFITDRAFYPEYVFFKEKMAPEIFTEKYTVYMESSYANANSSMASCAVYFKIAHNSEWVLNLLGTSCTFSNLKAVFYLLQQNSNVQELAESLFKTHTDKNLYACIEAARNIIIERKK